MDWKDFIADMNTDVAAFRTQAPATAKAFSGLAQAATADGALDLKTKELIALAIAVAVHCDPCIGYHARAVAKAGASRDEVAEALAMCVYMGGGPSLMYGSKALAAFDTFAAETG